MILSSTVVKCSCLFYRSNENMLYSSKVNIRIQGTVIGQSNNNRPPNFRSMRAFGIVIDNLFTEWYVVKAALRLSNSKPNVN